MRVFRFAFCLTFLALTTLSCWAQKKPLPTNVVPDGLGYNIHFTDAKPGEMEMIAESGATIIRMDFGWGGTERQKGVYDFSAFERLTDSLEKQNIRPLYILDYSNRHYDEGLSPHTPEGRAAFAKWAVAVAMHFKDRGIIWEMYNEPNIHFWKPKPNPDDYILLALEVGKALREAAPNETYIGPATSQIDFEFLEKCFKAGLLEYWDAVSVHPYRQQPPETVIPEYAKLRWMIDKYAPEGKHIPILSAEWGYSSAWGSYNDDIQGKMLPRQWMVNLACDIPISIWYDWHDDGTDPKEPEHHFGTTNFEYHKDRVPVYDPKPSYLAAKTFTEVFKGFKYNKRASGYYGHDVFVLLFTKGKEVRLAAWTTSTDHPGIAFIPAKYGTKFRIIDHLGQEIAKNKVLETGHTNPQGAVNVTDAPIYLIPENDDPMLTQVAEYPSLPMVLYLTESKFKEIDAISEQGWTDDRIRYHFDWFRSPEPMWYQLFSRRTRTEIYSTNPLYIRPSLAGKQWSFEIDNPSGDAFKGCVICDFPSDDSSHTILPVELKEGEKQKSVPFTIKPIDRKVTFKLMALFEAEGELSTPVDLIPSRPWQPAFCPFDDFSKYNAETLAANWGLFPDGDAKVDSEQTLAPGDEGAITVTYKFGDGWKFLRLAPKNNALAKIDGEPKSLTVRVNADGSGNSIRLRFRDSRGQTFQVDSGKMSERGMQYFTFRLTGENASHWGGPNDGAIQYPIMFDSIIIDGQRKAFGPSEIEVFAPVLVYEE